MRLKHIGRGTRPTLVCVRFLVATLLLSPLAAQDATEIIRKSLARDADNFERVKDYTYLARQEERELDKSGKIKSTESQTFDISILAGRRYERLVAENDKPLAAKRTEPRTGKAGPRAR